MYAVGRIVVVFESSPEHSACVCWYSVQLMCRYPPSAVIQQFPFLFPVALMTFSSWSRQEQRRPQLRDTARTVGLRSGESGGWGTITAAEHLAERVGGDHRSIVVVSTAICIRGRGFTVCLLRVGVGVCECFGLHKSSHIPVEEASS